ncbi:MAG: NAD(P)H-dependent oxidoreductase [Paludibacter sp.]|nr:NAD(P)H-dependent oxidoreductase [Paludibacter sp.]
MSLLESFQWRYATKKFDPTKKVSEENVNNILEAARLAPTSSGLQPFKVLLITNQEIKKQLVAAANGQEMVADCSHLLVFAAWDNYTEERIDHIYDITTQERNMPADRYDAYKNRLKTVYLNRASQTNFEHAARQAYIALGFAMAEAASLKVDSVPMEGFAAAEVDQILNLKESGLKTVLMLPLGYRDADNDWLLPQKKVRHPKDEFIVEIK